MIKRTIHLLLILLLCVGQVSAQGRAKKRKTLSNLMDGNEVVAIGSPVDSKLPIERADSKSKLVSIELKVDHVIKGKELLDQASPIRFDVKPESIVDGNWLVLATRKPTESNRKSNELAWATPIAVGNAKRHISELSGLRKPTKHRLMFFLKFLEHPNQVVAANVHLEFALASDEELDSIATSLNADEIARWLGNEKAANGEQRLYLALLERCGSQEHADTLERIIASRVSLNATSSWVACYLKLKGNSGVPFVRERFLAKDHHEYPETYETMLALRYLRESYPNSISRSERLKCFHDMLNLESFADLVIPELANEKDWSSAKRIVQLYEAPGNPDNWTRVPAIVYFKKWGTPETDQHLEKLKAIDPNSYGRANFFFGSAAFKSAPPAPIKTRIRPSGLLLTGFGC